MSLFRQPMDAWGVIAGVVALIGLALIAAGLVGDRSRGRRRCPRCWYSMSGSPGLVCPECGRDARHESRLFRRRRRWRLVLLGLVIGVVAAGGWGYRVASRDGVWAIVPFTAGVHMMPWYTEPPEGLLTLVQERVNTAKLASWQRDHLYRRMGAILENPRATRNAKVTALRMIERVSWLGNSAGVKGEAAGATATLIAALDDDTREIRMYAAGLLGSIGGDPATALAAVVPLMDEDPESTVRMAAVGTVGRLGETPEAGRIEIMERLRRSYGMSDAQGKYHCITTAGILIGAQAGALAWLIELLDDPDIEIAREACRALRYAGPDAEDATPALARVMSRDDQTLAQAAAETIKALGDPAGIARRGFLAAVSRHAGFDPVFAAYESTYRGLPGTIDDLLGATSTWTAREGAFASAFACDHGADPAALLPLLERAVRTVGPDEKEAAWTGVYKWAFIGGCRDRSLLEFLPAVDAPTNPGEVWRAALRGRIAGADAGAVATIAAVLAQDAKWTASWTRAAAAEALGHFGELAGSTVPALRALLKDEAAEPRQRAREAIARITGVKPASTDGEDEPGASDEPEPE